MTTEELKKALSSLSKEDKEAILNAKPKSDAEKLAESLALAKEKLITAAKKKKEKHNEAISILESAKTEEEKKKAEEDEKKAAAELNAAKLKACRFVAVPEMQKNIHQPVDIEFSSFLPEKKERAHIHVQLEKLHFDSATQERKSVPYTQIFDEKQFKNFMKHDHGYTVRMLWDGVAYSKI